MTNYSNELGQSLGFPVAEWRERPHPPRTAMTGRHCVVEPLQPGIHAADLYQAYMEDTEHRGWTYMPYGPFHTFEAYRGWLESYCIGDDPLFHAIIDLKTSRAAGVASASGYRKRSVKKFDCRPGRQHRTATSGEKS